MLYRFMTTGDLSRVADADLLVEVRRLATVERGATTQLIAALMEVDARRLYLGEGCSSLFRYCTEVLRLSEHAAYGRIEAARAARRYAPILDLLSDGSITLTTVSLLAQHLTADNHTAVLAAAQHKTKREVEQLVVTLQPRPAVAAQVRKLPSPPRPNAAAALSAIVDAHQPCGGKTPAALRVQADQPLPTAQRPPVVAPVTPERFKIQFTVSRATYEQLRRAQDLLRHVIANGDVGAVFEKALTRLLADLEKRRLAATDRPRHTSAVNRRSRRIPAATRRAVWQRDGGRCAFVGAHGRCSETGFPEFHHLTPYAAGGETTADNLELRCRAHNAYEAERYFGVPLFARERRAGFGASMQASLLLGSERYSSISGETDPSSSETKNSSPSTRRPTNPDQSW